MSILIGKRMHRGVDISFVRELEAEQARHASIIDAIPVMLQCPGHVRGQWPLSCVVCAHEDQITNISNQLIAIFDGRRCDG